jgi:hypothetical protein
LPSTLCRIPDGAQLSESAGWKNATTTATFAVFQSSLTSAHLHQQSPLTAIESELVSRPPTSTVLYPALPSSLSRPHWLPASAIMDQQQKTAPPVYDLSQGGHYGASAAVSNAISLP